MSAPAAGAKLHIRRDDLTGEAILDLLRLHLDAMQANSPPGTVFALDGSGLKDPSVTIWSGWIGGALAGGAR